MGPRIREDDELSKSVILAHAGIHPNPRFPRPRDDQVPVHHFELARTNRNREISDGAPNRFGGPQ
jgi:hypothetical protein